MSCAVLSLLFTLLFTGHAKAVTAEDVISRARKHVATEDKLNAINTLILRGHIFDPEGKQTDNIQLFFKKPDKERIVYDNDVRVDITVCNGHEGHKQHTMKENNRMRLYLLKHSIVHGMLVDARENLYFYRAYEGVIGARVTYAGKAQVQGQEVDVLKYSYPGDVSFTRYIDPKTGALIASDDKDGIRSVENETMVVDGIRFPKAFKTYNAEGLLLMTIKFEEITVNKPLDDQLFDFNDEWYKRDYWKQFANEAAE